MEERTFTIFAKAESSFTARRYVNEKERIVVRCSRDTLDEIGKSIARAMGRFNDCWISVTAWDGDYKDMPGDGGWIALYADGMS